jgi:phosphatidylinositol glycan class N
MALIGILYLAFQKRLLGNTKLSDESVAPANDSLSRALVGIQVSKCD